VIWLPPFLDIGSEDTWGTYVWHVKQRNNGISFLLSAESLDFVRLKDQNEPTEPTRQNGLPVSIVHEAAKHLSDAARRSREEMEQLLGALSAIGNADISRAIAADVLLHRQGLLVRSLNEFLDDCYLDFLIEAMNGNPSTIKLQKSKVQVTPPREDAVGTEADSTWLTVQSLISDMWRAYKFEPYRTKVEMLFRSVDFALDLASRQFLAKHIAIRNCIQHKEGVLDLETLQLLGVTELTVRSSSAHATIARGQPIVMFPEEVADLAEALCALGRHFDAHVLKRVRARRYLPRL
jgi:hypothetical protein